MKQPANRGPSRRTFLKKTSRVAAASALAGAALPHVHAAENNTIQVALIGCGGRGTGAAANALSVTNGPIKLVALGDVFENRLTTSYTNLQRQFKDRVDVPRERQFVGFDAYQKAMDCLKPGDVAIFASPVAFRWVHFGYAISRGINVFMEKPITVDGPSTRKMLKLAEESEKKNIKVGVGLMCRHCVARQELHDRIKAGQIGDIITMRAYRMHGPGGTAGPRPADMSELLYQVRRFHAFLWASGGIFSDYLIHNIDECCWMKDAWPVQAQGSGARCYRGNSLDQNFDVYSVEYTFADGSKLFLNGRYMNGCHSEFASYAHGSKGAAVISTNRHTPARCRIYKNQLITDFMGTSADLVWRYAEEEPPPFQLEWDHLIEAIRKDRPYNEAKRGAEASLVTAMGRMACHTGQIITYDQILNHTHELAPDLDKLTADSLPPLCSTADGKYPVPQPGIVTQREF
jgi:predicted dehydrogenase